MNRHTLSQRSMCLPPAARGGASGGLVACMLVALALSLGAMPARAVQPAQPEAGAAGLQHSPVDSALLPGARWTTRAMPLATLLEAGVSDGALAAAQAEHAALAARAEQIEHGSGWQMFAALRYSEVREIIDERRDSRYGTRVLSAGLQHPLLGSLWQQRQAISSARFEAARQHEAARLVDLASRRTLRVAYADWWRAEQELRWCVDVMHEREAGERALAQRLDLGQITRAEAERLRQQWFALAQRCEAAVDARLAQFDQLRRLTPMNLDDAHQAVPEDLIGDTQALYPLLESLPGHPALGIGRLRVDEARAARQMPGYAGINSQFQLATAIESRPGFGRPGRDVSVGVSVAFPLGLADYQAAQRRHDAARLDAALAQYQAQSIALHQLFERLREAYDQALRDLAREQRHWQFVQLADGETRLRSEAGLSDAPPGVAERIEAGFGLIERWHAAWLQLIEIEQFAEALGSRLPGAVQDGGNPAAGNPQSPPRRWTAPGSAALPAAPARADAPRRWLRGVYVWDSHALLDPARRSEALGELREAGMARLHVGLDAAQVADPERTRAQLAALIDEALAHDLQVTLLLGEPTWITPAGRPALLELIERFRGLPFHALHLDLEVEQLGWPVPPQRLHDWLDTLRAVAERSPWPLEISSHHRWFAPPDEAGPCVPCELQALGIARVSLMIYTRNAARSQGITEEIAQRWPGLRFRLAQSVERVLPAQESWFGATQDELDTAGQGFRTRLAPLGVEGIDWQDWADYPRMRSR